MCSVTFSVSVPVLCAGCYSFLPWYTNLFALVERVKELPHDIQNIIKLGYFLILFCLSIKIF